MDEEVHKNINPPFRPDHELPASFSDHEVSHEASREPAPPAPSSVPTSPLAPQPVQPQQPPTQFQNPPQPAAPAPQLPPTQTPPQQPAAPHPGNANAVTIILQWLTYAFWGWTVLILSILTYAVFTDFLDQGDSSSFNYYIISAALVLLPISLVCDYLYSKKEPQRKVGGASVVMIIHAVLFALFGIGSLIWAVFSLVSLLTSGGDDNSTAFAGLYSSIIIVAFYAATFVRTLNPPKFPWIDKAYKIFMLVTIVIFIILGFAGAHHNVNKQTADTAPDYNSSPSTNYNYPDKEEVNKQGQRRPVQYLHICDTPGGSIEYVSQGTPKCLTNADIYQSDYDPSVAGTVFSSPCKTNSGKLRYVYISNDETCPPNTTLLFYNSLGGSTSGPGGSIVD